MYMKGLVRLDTREELSRTIIYLCALYFVTDNNVNMGYYPVLEPLSKQLWMSSNWL